MKAYAYTFQAVVATITILTSSVTAQDQSLRLQNVDAITFSQVRIKSPPSNATSLMPTEVTIEAWISPLGPGFGHTTDDPYGADIAYRGDGTTPTGLTVASWVLRWSPNSMLLNFQFNSAETLGEIWFSNTAVPIGTKAHVAMTFNGQVARLYVNGVLDTEKPWPHAIYYEVEDSVWVGTGQGVLTDPLSYVRRFDGTVDSLRIWDHARTAAEIKSTMSCGSLDPGNGLRGSWNFDDGTAHDASGYGNVGEIGGPGAAFVSGIANQQDCGFAWTNLLHAKGGIAGLPQLVGSGQLLAGSVNGLHLAGAPPFAAVALVVGLTEIDAPFKGGTLVPSVLMVVVLPADATGSLEVPFVLPPTTPAGVSLYLQAWIHDAAASFAVSASNGLKGVTS